MTEAGRFTDDPSWQPAINAGLLREGDHMEKTHIDAKRPDGTIITDIEVTPISAMDGQATYLIPKDANIILELFPPNPKRI